ncbi:MAG: chemotaxis protein CheB [Rhodanobacteraceae bacterium]
MSENPPKSLPVALVYGESESSQVLRSALGEIGANLVCDADIASFSIDDLGTSGADVVLISLDAIIEDRLDEVYGALDEQRYRVMFDDPEITNNLDGWEHARWQRHLAAKLHDISDWDPPRPKDAAAVEVTPQSTGDAGSGASGQPDAEAAPAWMDEALSVLHENDADGDNTDGGADQPQNFEATDAAPAAQAQVAAAQETLESDLAEQPDGVADNDETPPATADLAAPESAPEDSHSAAPQQVEDVTPADAAAGLEEDADLQAELDALAEADDPLAALSALAGEEDESVASETSGENTGSGEIEQARNGDISDASVPSSAEIDLPGELSLDLADKDDDTEGESTAQTAAASDEQSEDWSTLEAELNAAFDSETLGAIDQASDSKDEQPVQAPSWELADDNSEPQAESSPPKPQPTTAADGQEPAESGDATPGISGQEATPAEQKASVDLPASDTSDEPVARPADLPDVSKWALVDDDDPVAAQDEAPPRAEADAAAEEQAAAESAANHGAGADDDGFGLELVDPIDYLRPDTSNAPKDVSNELFNMPTLQPMAEALAPKVGDEDETAEPDTSTRIKRVVVLGASIGGPDAVRTFLSHLPQQLPASIVLVQHLGSEFVDLMVSQLSKSSALPVRIPGRAERAIHGEVLVVPSGCQLSISPQGQIKVRELDGEAANNPSINLTMSMAAEAFGANATAIIFSGMASDAVAGALEIAAHGGQVWVQDPESCVVSNMVDDVIEAGAARFTGTPEALAKKLVALLQETDDE